MPINPALFTAVRGLLPDGESGALFDEGTEVEFGATFKDVLFTLYQHGYKVDFQETEYGTGYIRWLPEHITWYSDSLDCLIEHGFTDDYHGRDLKDLRAHFHDYCVRLAEHAELPLITAS